MQHPIPARWREIIKYATHIGNTVVIAKSTL